MATINIGAGVSRADKVKATRIRGAIAHLDAQLGGRWEGRASAVRSIERAHSPLKEAKRISEWRIRKLASPTMGKQDRTRARGKGVRYVWPKNHQDHRDAPDHSDVQVLRVKIADRDGALACATHKRMLARLDRDIARGRLMPEQFAKRAAEIMRTPQAWPKDVIKDEIGAHTIEAAPVDQLAAGRAADAPLYRDRFAFLHRSPGGGRQLVTTAP
jgi:hypothetical protein